MTKLKEQAMNDLNELNSIEVAKVYELIQFIKCRKQHPQPLHNTAYLKVREALQTCSGSLSDDVYHDREERL